MRYPLFLSDFDGTLVRADGTVSQENIQAIADYRAAGGVFAVVTGRMLRSILPRLKELGIEEGLVAAYQGGMIADIRTGKVISERGFSPKEAIRAVRLLEEKGEHIHVYLKDELYCNRDDELLRIYERVCGVKGTVSKIPLSELVRERDRKVTKVIAMLEPERKGALMRELEERLGSGYSVTTSAAWLVEVLPEGADKGAAVRALCERYRVEAKSAAAIGDQLNDLPMLLAAGGRFAVAGAEEELKKIATVVASCEDNGVREALQYAMGEER